MLNRKALKQITKKRLQHTRDLCKFKKAFFPKGWTCVHIETFAGDLAKEIYKKQEAVRRAEELVE